jgi:hypothetical protein
MLVHSPGIDQASGAAASYGRAKADKARAAAVAVVTI